MASSSKEKEKSMCDDKCLGFVGCMVLDNQPYRDYSEYISGSKEKKSVKEEVSRVRDTKKENDERVFFPVPSSSKEKSIAMAGMLFTKWLDDYGFPMSSDTIFTFKDLSKLSKSGTNGIPLGTLDRAYLVRYKDPWDFHVILETSEFYQLEKQNWEKYNFSPFAHKIKYEDHPEIIFESGLGMFRGFIFMLSRYITRLQKDKILDIGLTFRVQDLVVCAVKRELPTLSSRRSYGTFGYRGVVIKEEIQKVPLRKSGGDTHLVEKRVLHVYLLDTGETRVVENGGPILAPLPEAFIAFPPLAVPCALHGASPITSEWSAEAKKEMGKLICPEKVGGTGVQLTLEFHRRDATTVTKMTDDKTAAAPSLQPPRPYFVEMSACVEEQVLNLSTELIAKNLALAWNPFPNKPTIAKYYFNTHGKSTSSSKTCGEAGAVGREGQGKKEFQEFERGAILHVSGGDKGNPQKASCVNESDMKGEAWNAHFLDQRRLDGQVVKTNSEEESSLGGNVLALRLEWEGEDDETKPIK